MCALKIESAPLSIVTATEGDAIALATSFLMNGAMCLLRLCICSSVALCPNPSTTRRSTRCRSSTSLSGLPSLGAVISGAHAMPNEIMLFLLRSSDNVEPSSPLLAMNSSCMTALSISLSISGPRESAPTTNHCATLTKSSWYSLTYDARSLMPRASFSHEAASSRYSPCVPV